MAAVLDGFVLEIKVVLAAAPEIQARGANWATVAVESLQVAFKLLVGIESLRREASAPMFELHAGRRLEDIRAGVPLNAGAGDAIQVGFDHALVELANTLTYMVGKSGSNPGPDLHVFNHAEMLWTFSRFFVAVRVVPGQVARIEPQQALGATVVVGSVLEAMHLLRHCSSFTRGGGPAFMRINHEDCASSY